MYSRNRGSYLDYRIMGRLLCECEVVGARPLELH